VDQTNVTRLHSVDSRLPTPATARWKLLRLGIQNLWEYDAGTRFVAHDGRLLLRGHNESGKSKAVELTVPAVLDAILRPERLDPFGEQSRLMRANLIGPHTPDNHTIVSGYAWAEFGRVDAERNARFATYGYGVRASRTAPGHSAWYFRSDRRVDVDLHLVVDGQPLSPARLEEALDGQGRVFVDDRDGYRHEVNHMLFGLADFRQFEKLMDLLLELRKPGLGKRLKAEDLSDMLSSSLPGLDLELLANVADGFNRLEEHRAELDQLKETRATLMRFNTTYRRYLQTAVGADAAAVRSAETQVDRASTCVRDAAGELEQVTGKLQRTVVAQQELAETTNRLEERLDTLRNTEAFRASQELSAARRQADDWGRQEQRSQKRADAEARGREAAEATAARRRQEAEDERQAVRLTEDEASRKARPPDLSIDQQQAVEQVAAGGTPAARALVETAVSQVRRRVAELAPRDESVAGAEREVDKADARSTELDERAQLDQRAAERAETELRAAIERLRHAVERWATGTSELPVDDDLAEELMTIQVDRAAQVALEAGRRHQRRLGEELADRRLELRQSTSRRDELAQERDDLLAQAFSPPAAPGWRRRDPQRPGAPLYLLAAFRPSVPQDVQAAVEAALEDSGLLDAWVTPDGAVHTVAGDITLRPGDGDTDVAGSLLAVLEPVAAGGVPPDVAGRALATIGYGSGPQDQPGDAAAWLAADGRWQAGCMVGQHCKDTIAYVGEEARRRAREQRLAELAALLTDAERQVAGLADAVSRLEARIAEVDDDLARFPPLQPVTEARAAEAATNSRARTSQAEAAEAARDLTAARARAAILTHERDRVAAELGLTLWTGRLSDLSLLVTEYQQAAGRWLAAARVADQAARRAGDAEEAAAHAGERLREAEEELGERRTMRARADERVRTLVEMIGADGQRILAEVHETESELARNRREQQLLQEAKETLIGDKARTGQVVVDAQERHGLARELRTRAATRFQHLAAAGLIAAAVDLEPGTLPEASPLEWAERPTLEVARRVAEATAGLEIDEESRNRRESAVQKSFQQLTVALPPELGLTPHRRHEVLTYSVVYARRERSTIELAQLLAEDIADRERRLSAEDRELIDRFLSGEIRDNIRRTLLDAQALIDDINRQLVARHTPSGQRVRLDWELDPTAPAGTREALDLLRSTPGVHAGRDAALREFLHERLDAARANETAASFAGRLADVLDYRQWHHFVVKQRRGDDQQWSPLTRKVHGEGSGGSKSATLHLPLFAAAAAFYASAGEHAPRLIALDEAFAGIDDQTTAKLLDLTVEWDFDLVMTGWRDWMCFPEVPGLSIYEIVRDKDAHVVDTEWWVWDGQACRAMAS
jgi:uncharacterized protein (TIGR02680 family)